MTFRLAVADMAKLLLLLAFLFHSTTSQEFRTCGPSAPCVALRKCPSMVALLRQGGHQDVIRNALCNSVGIVSYVCCATQGDILVLSTERPTPFPSLLPRICGLPFTQDKIIGGKEAPFGAYPWMAAFRYKKPSGEVQFDCAGSVISKRYILTAAHCLDAKELGSRKLDTIHLGDHDLSQNGRDCQKTRAGDHCGEPHVVVRVESLIFHPDYNKRAKSSDDIALIRIDRDLDFRGGAIQPICLPNSTLEVKSFVGNRMPVAAGWGHTETEKTSNILLSAHLPVAADSQCKKRYNSKFVSNQLCIGGQGGVDTCTGDSGGPLIVSGPTSPPYIQIGIVSYGPFPCAIPGTPGVYTDVSKYVDWIESKLRA